MSNATSIKYRISGIFGKRVVEFACPTCTAPLECPLTEAGNSYDCPTCGAALQVPGTTELDELKRKVREREQRKADEAKAAESIEREQEAAKAQKLAYESAVAKAKENGPPEYAGIVTGAYWLTAFAGISIVLGAICVIGGVIGFIVAMRPDETRAAAAGAGSPFLIAPSIAAILAGILYIGLGAILRMFGEMGLALRDLSRNSFRDH